MASYHFEVKSHNKQDKSHAGIKSDYVNREGKYKNMHRDSKKDEIASQTLYIGENIEPTGFDRDISVADKKLDYITRDGKFKDLHSPEELQYKESGNMPAWAKENPREFWNASEMNERANGTTFREMIFALPNELGLEEQKEMIDDFRKTNFPNNAYSFAIHKINATIAPDVEQPHVHLIICERLNDGIERSPEQYFKRYNRAAPEKGGALKDRSWAGTYKERVEHLKKIRETFATTQNKYLEKYDHEARVDHRTLKEQYEEAVQKGDFKRARILDRPAETKLGPKASRVMIRGLQKQRSQQNGSIDGYFEKPDINPKVAYNFTVRRMRRLSEQIAQEYERKENPAKAYHVNLSKELTYEDLPELLATIDGKLTDINLRIKVIAEEKEKLAPHVKTEIDAINMAQAKIFSFDKQKLNRLKNQIFMEKKKFEEAYEAFSKEDRPNVFLLAQRKNYDLHKEEFAKWKKNIKEIEFDYDLKRHELFIKSNEPNNKIKLEKIKAEILLGNSEIRDKFYLFVSEEKQLKGIALNYRNFRKEAVDAAKYTKNRSSAIKAANSALQRFNLSMQRISQNSSASIRAKLYDDTDHPVYR